LYVWNAQGSLDITSTSLAFFRKFSSSVSVGTYASSTSSYATLTAAIKAYADEFIGVVAKYTPSDGGLAEQYSKSDGTPLSAVDLTWSYASVITTFQARAWIVPASWGANGLTVPTICQPGSGAGGGGGKIKIATTFNVEATTVEGGEYRYLFIFPHSLNILTESIHLTGSDSALEDWSPDFALLLSATKYSIWTITVDLPASTPIEYKYIRKLNGVVTWEPDPNMLITTPANGTYLTNDTWRWFGKSGCSSC
jgi:glucoamylase